MIRSVCCFGVVLVVCATAQQSMILDDFMSADGKNRIGLSWYYFSDENDSGVSIINNASRKTGGGYSDIVYDTVDDSTNRCGTIDFALGDPELVQYFYKSFVGIGTDIAVPGQTVDMRGLQVVRFRLRSVPAMVVTFEIVSAATPGFRDYYRDVEVAPEWREFIVSVNELKQPTWISRKYEVSRDSALSLARKFNWKIYSCNDGYENGTIAGCLMIDVVFIEGSGPLWERIPTPVLRRAMTVRRTEQHLQSSVVFDLLGREVGQQSGRRFDCPRAMIFNSPARSSILISP